MAFLSSRVSPSVVLLFSIVLGAAIAQQECPADKNKPWSYDDSLSNGPSHWGDTYPDCNKDKQSPIRILQSRAKKVKNPKQNKLPSKGYDDPVGKVKIENMNGYFVRVTPEDGKARSVKIHGDSYDLKYFDLHWGNKSKNLGTQHALGSKFFPMEIEFVHMNSNGDRVHVAQILTIGDSNSALDKILYVKDNYEYANGSFEGTVEKSGSDDNEQGKIYLNELLYSTCDYYRYEGSLTYPPCTEGVIWLFCRVDQHISQDQLDDLYSLYSVEKGNQNEDDCHLINIRRPLQDTNNRKVTM